MKLFLDTANLQEIKEAMQWGVIDGVTTNPTLAAREGGDFRELLAEICRIVPGSVSAEVIATETEGMVREARELASVAPQVAVKIPVTPDGIRAVKILAAEGIKCNVTLIFSFNQALLAAKAGACYVSPFVGRLDDIGHDGMALVADISRAFSHYGFSCEVIAASIRHPRHVIEAAMAGSHIATVPFSVLKQMFNHPLTDLGIERFLSDWQKAQKAKGNTK